MNFSFFLLNRSVFGGSVGPNPLKSNNTNDGQYYDGIKVRAQPLAINLQTTTTNNNNNNNTNNNANNPSVVQTTPVKTVRRKGQVITAPTTTPNISVVADATDTPPVSPASPILKAQLSAPPKQRETVNKGEVKSQVILIKNLT